MQITLKNQKNVPITQHKAATASPPIYSTRIRHFFTQIYLLHLPCLFITECFLNFGSNLNSIHLDSFICSQFLKSSLLQFLTNISIIILIAAPPFKLNCCLALQSSFPASTSLLVLENYVFVAERQKDRKKKDRKTKTQSCSHRFRSQPRSTSNNVFLTAVTTTTIVTETMIMMVANCHWQ